MCLLKNCDAFTSIICKYEGPKLSEDWDLSISTQDEQKTINRVEKRLEIFGCHDSSWRRFTCLERWRQFGRVLFGSEPYNLQECCKY